MEKQKTNSFNSQSPLYPGMNIAMQAPQFFPCLQLNFFIMSLGFSTLTILYKKIEALRKEKKK